MAKTSCLAFVFCGFVGFGASLLATGVSGCKPSPMAKIEKLRDALVLGDAASLAAATEGVTRCDSMPMRANVGCLQEAATQLGSKAGFNSSPPDQAGAATAALVLAREKHGDWLPSPPDGWLDAVITGSGPGPDALRVALVQAMTEAEPAVARKIDEEKDALPLLAAVSLAIPGACTTYALLGGGADPAKMAPEMQADHAPCVQQDLSRKDGPGGAYGFGTLRAAEGAVALWKDALRSLRDGTGRMAAPAKAVVEAKLGPLEIGAMSILLKKLPPPPDNSMFMSDVHRDAGVPMKNTPPPSGAPSVPAFLKSEVPRGDAGPRPLLR